VVHLLQVGVSNDADHICLSAEQLELFSNHGGVFGDLFLLALVSRLQRVCILGLHDTSQELLRQVLSPDHAELLQPVRGLLLPDHTDHGHWRGLDQRDDFGDVLAVDLGACALHVA
jgi:hypothetical protein